MKKVYCVMGRTASGKTSLTKEVCKQTGMKVVKSYTTRPARNNEDKDSDHIFISSSDVDKYKNNIVAYTKIGEYEYFATERQLFDCDFYVIDPIGYYSLVDYITRNNLDIQLETIYVTIPYNMTKERAKLRKDNVTTLKERIESENEQFSQFEKSGSIHYRILNDGSFEDGVNKFLRILRRDRGDKEK